MYTTPNGLTRPQINDDPLITDFDGNWDILESLLRESTRSFRADVIASTNVALVGNTPTIDGMIWREGQTVLCINQTDPSTNGPWQIVNSTVIGWARPPWYGDTSGTTTTRHRFCWVTGGKSYAGTTWFLSNDRLPVINRDPQRWQQLSPTTVIQYQNTTTSGAAVANIFEPIDTTSGNIVKTLPLKPPDRTRFGFKHVIQGGTNTVTINTQGTDVFNNVGGSTSLTLPLLKQASILQYQASTGIYFVVSDDLSLAQLDLRYAPASQTTSFSYVAKSGNYTLTNSDDVVEYTASGFTLTFHSAVTATKKRYTIKNSSTGNISFATTSSQTVDGVTSGTILPMQSLEAVPNGSNWVIT